MYVYILISEYFDPDTMEYSDQSVKRIEGVYKNEEDADHRRLDLEHEEELFDLMHPGYGNDRTSYHIQEHEVR